MVIDLNAYKNKQSTPLDEYEVLSMILDCQPHEMLVVTNMDSKLRVTKVRASRFIVNPEKF